MSTSLYDISIGTYTQILEAVSGVLDKGRTHCESNGIDLNDLVETRIHADMKPFRFQIISDVNACIPERASVTRF